MIGCEFWIIFKIMNELISYLALFEIVIDWKEKIHFLETKIGVAILSEYSEEVLES